MRLIAIDYLIGVCGYIIEQLRTSEAYYELRHDTRALKTSLPELTWSGKKLQQRKLGALTEGWAFLDVVHREDALKLDEIHELNTMNLLSLDQW